MASTLPSVSPLVLPTKTKKTGSNYSKTLNDNRDASAFSRAYNFGELSGNKTSALDGIGFNQNTTPQINAFMGQDKIQSTDQGFFSSAFDNIMDPFGINDKRMAFMEKAGFGKDFNYGSMDENQKRGYDAANAEWNDMQANQFDWGGAIGTIGSAFDTFGPGGSMERGKKNIELADAQIGALNMNMKNKQAFLDGTTSAFATN